MKSKSFPFQKPRPQRRFYAIYGFGLVALACVFLLANRWIEANAQLYQEALFGEQQLEYAKLASHTLSETLNLPVALADTMSSTSSLDFLVGRMDKQAAERRFGIIADNLPYIFTLAVFNGPDSVAAVFDKSTGVGREQARLWASKHWNPLSEAGRSPYVPRLFLSSENQLMGILHPVVDADRFLGLTVVVVELAPIFAKFLPAQNFDEHGQAHVLDDEGNVVFGHPDYAPGSNVFDPAQANKPRLTELNRRIISELNGMGAYETALADSGSGNRMFTAWSSATLANRRLAVVLTASEASVLDNIQKHHRLHMGLNLGLLTLLAASAFIVYRKTLYADVIASHRKLMDVIEFLPDPTFVVDRDGVIVAWNKAIAQMTGVPSEDMVGKGDFEYSNPFYGQRRPALVDLLDTTEAVRTDRYPVIRRGDGTIYAETFVPLVYGGRGAHVWATASRLLDRNGKTAGAIESIRDTTDRIRTEQKLRMSEERYALSVRGANDGIWDWDLKDDSVYFSPRWKEIIGYEDHELGDHADEWKSRIHPKDVSRVMEANMSVLNGVAEHFEVEYRLRHKDGSYRWVLGRGAGLRDKYGNIQRMAGAHTDITQRKESEIASAVMLGVSNAVSSTRGLSDLYGEVHRLLFEYIGADTFYIALVNPDNDLIEFVYARDPHHGQAWEPVSISSLDGGSLTMAVFNANQSMRLSKEKQIELRVMGNVAKQWLGAPIRIQGEAVGVMAINDYFDSDHFTDKDLQLLEGVAEQVGLALERRDNEERLTRQALHDTLTGQPNRTLLRDRLERAITRRSRRPDWHFAVVMLDLDRFKLINDSHGHSAGDQVLCEVSKRIAPALRSADTLARMGGDEFAILLENFDKPQQIIHIIRRIQEAVAQPMDVEGITISTTASAGVVIRTEGYETPEELLRDADIAMYQAKNQGKGLFRVFNPGMHLAAMEAMELEADLSSALEKQEFFLDFQPLYRADGTALTGFEALLRWERPGKGLVLPGDFIPTAEETGLIVPIGEWAMHKACATMADWLKSTPEASDLILSVNISARQAAHTNLVAMVRKALSNSGLPPDNLELELTETAAMQDPQMTLSILKRLKELGVGLAIDDFGTGYSSLSHLSRFPMDTLKVDRSFVAGLDQAEGNREIVHAVIGLAKVLNLRVVAEGVETSRQHEQVRDLGCNTVQGFHLGRPMDEASAHALIERLSGKRKS